MINLNPAQGPRLIYHLNVVEGKIMVRAGDSPRGEATARFDAEPVQLQLPPLDEMWEMTRQPVFHDEVGRALFRALMAGDRRDRFVAAQQSAAAAGSVLTLELRFDRTALHLARYPWELLHDGARFLLATQAINLVRAVPFAMPFADAAPVSDSGAPLEMLVAEPTPRGLPALMAEFDALQQTLDPALRTGRLDLAYLMPPTWDALMDWLLAGAPDVLHVAGHGDRAGAGLIFEDGRGGPDAVAGLRVGDALYSTRLKLLVLSATSATKPGGESGWGAVAPALIAAGIPAVVAMQQALPEAAAQRFARGFYATLLAGRGIEAAIQSGRKQLARSTFWYIPTLTRRAVALSESAAAAVSVSLREVSVNTAAPQIAPVHEPFRLGVWVSDTSAPPDAEAVRRLIGWPLAANMHDPAAQMAQRVPVVEPLQPGPVTIRVSAAGADVHVRRRTTALWPGEVMPPVWVPITPHQTGSLVIQIDLVQGDSVIAAVTHIIQVVEDEPRNPSARVYVWRLNARPERKSGEFDSLSEVSATGEYGSVDSESPTLLPDDDSPSPEKPRSRTGHERELWYNYEHEQREREKDRRRARDAAAVTPDAAQHEPLDGVLDWLQAGEQPVREKDDPLIGSDEFERHGEDFESFPAEDMGAPTVDHVFEQDAADRTLAGDDWVRSDLDDADESTVILDTPTPDTELPGTALPGTDQADVEPPGADQPGADRAEDSGVKQITDEEWIEWMSHWRTEE